MLPSPISSGIQPPLPFEVNPTIDQFIQEESLKSIGSGWQVRVVANPNFPHQVVKEYDCSRGDLTPIFDAEVAALRRIEVRLQSEKLTRVVFPQLLEAKTKGSCLFEMFPRIYPPDATSEANDGQMIGLSLSKEAYRQDGQYELAGRGKICEPQHLDKYFKENVPLVLQELGKAFALLHFKAFIICKDVEIVIGKSGPKDPLKLFIIDFDRAIVEPIFSKQDFLKKMNGVMSTNNYFKYLYYFNQSDVFQNFSKVDEKYKKPFVQGYLETAENLGYHDEAKAVISSL